MPRFLLEISPPVKREGGWEVTALATVLYGNRPPDPPEEVVFDVNGQEFERTETNPESGIARSVMILQAGGYVVTTYRPMAERDDRDARRSRSFAIRDEKEFGPIQKKTAAINAKKALVQAQKELKQAKGPEPKRRLEILGTDVHQTGVLEILLCRLGKDGKLEPGAIHYFDRMLLSRTMEADKEYILVVLPLRDRSRKVVFYLPDDREVKTTVEVPALPTKVAREERRGVEPIQAGHRIAEAWRRGRRRKDEA